MVSPIILWLIRIRYAVMGIVVLSLGVTSAVLIHTSRVQKPAPTSNQTAFARSSPLPKESLFAPAPNGSACPTETATGCERSGTASQPTKCLETKQTTITASPIAFNDLLWIQPMGLMIGGHVTPIDHGYFYVKGAMQNPPTRAPVYAPINGTITIMHREHRGGDSGAKADAPKNIPYDDYSLTIEGSCAFRIRFSN